LIEAKRLRRWERKINGYFNIPLIATKADKEQLTNSDSEHTEGITVLNNGTDLDSFKFQDDGNRESALILMGQMDYFPNIYVGIYFYTNIFPLIKK